MVRLLMERGADARSGIWPYRKETQAVVMAAERGYGEIVATSSANRNASGRSLSPRPKRQNPRWNRQRPQWSVATRHGFASAMSKEPCAIL